MLRNTFGNVREVIMRYLKPDQRGEKSSEIDEFKYPKPIDWCKGASIFQSCTK